MANELQVDLVVIGAGPAGQTGAVQAAKAGKRAVIVDRLGVLGGACLNQGTVPSKTLRSVILDLTGFTQSVYHGGQPRGPGEISVEDLLSRVERVIADENRVLAEECASNGVLTAFGTARFADAHTVEVVDGQGQITDRITADKALIATGSHPRHPIDLPEGGDRLFVDSDLVFCMERIPKSLIVLGGGIISCEYATMFAALGVEVTLVDRRDDLLRMLDAEILLKDEGGVLQAETVFYSMGRIANVEGLQLQNAGIELTELGFIPTNPLFQTSVDHVYAAGDVIGPPSLASTSAEQGRLAVRNAFLLRSHHFPEFFPYGIYTIPEISSVGPTEEQLKEKGTHYEVGRAYYYEMARGPIAGDTQGLIKMLFHAETREILAVHIIGTHATELISLGQMALSFRVQLDYFVDTIFNYPTFAEGFRIAALNGLNKTEVDS